MTNNQDALRCAETLDAGENFYGESSLWYDTKLADAAADSADHLRRLVRENEALRESINKANQQAEHFEREWYLRGDQVEAKDALLRQALGALEFHQEQTRPIHRTQNIIATIKQHLGQKGETG